MGRLEYLGDIPRDGLSAGFVAGYGDHFRGQGEKKEKEAKGNGERGRQWSRG